MATYPYSYRWAQHTNDVRNNPRNIMFVGDSLLDASVQGNLVRAFCQRYKAQRTVGFTIPACGLTSQSATLHGPGQVTTQNISTGGATGTSNRISAYPQNITGGAQCMSPGLRLYSTAQPTLNSSFAISLFWMTAAQRAALYGGDPFASATQWTSGYALLQEIGALGGAGGNMLAAQTSVNDAGAFSAFAGSQSAGRNPWINSATPTLVTDQTTYAKPGSGNPAVWLYASAGTFFSASPGNYCNIVGYKLACDVAGTTYSFMAHSSATTYAYTAGSGTLDSTAGIDAWLGLTGVPDVLWFNLGTNATAGEITDTLAGWKTKILNAVTNVKNRVVAAGKTPRVVLTVPHYTGKDYLSGSYQRFASYYLTLEQAMFEVAAERVALGEDWCVINLLRLITVDRGGNTVSVTNGDTTAAASITGPLDGVHFSNFGADLAVDTINAEGDAAIVSDRILARSRSGGGSIIFDD